MVFQIASHNREFVRHRMGRLVLAVLRSGAEEWGRGGYERALRAPSGSTARTSNFHVTKPSATMPAPNKV
jgi:hypothetical protein